LLLGAQRDSHFFYGVVPVPAVFDSANYRETAELTATFNPHDFSGVAKLTLPRYQIERGNVHLDLQWRA
jgi:hypothetical protein